VIGAVVLLSPKLRDRLFAPADWARLEQLVEVRHLGTRVPGALPSDIAVAVTGWDTEPALMVNALRGLQFVAHTGGSVRAILPRELFHRGVRVSQVAAVLADGVAEFTVMSIIAGLRDAHGYAAALADGATWGSLAARPPGRLLRDATVGIVGASRTGLATIERLRPFDCRLLVADPFLDEGRARELGVEPVSLDDLVARADVVSLHAPVLPSTIGMLGASQIAAMRDGAVLVNTARAALVDEDAVLAAASSGRIRLLTDVFPVEPLPDTSPWRTTPGVVATPHIAALTRETLHEQGRQTVAEIERFLSGQPLLGEIEESAYDRIA